MATSKLFDGRITKSRCRKHKECSALKWASHLPERSSRMLAELGEGMTLKAHYPS